MPFAFTTVALELIPGKADLVEWPPRDLIRREGVTGQPVWDAARPARPFDPNHDPAPWRLVHFGSAAASQDRRARAGSRRRWHRRRGLGVDGHVRDRRFLGQEWVVVMVVRRRARRAWQSPTRRSPVRGTGQALAEAWAYRRRTPDGRCRSRRDSRSDRHVRFLGVSRRSSTDGLRKSARRQADTRPASPSWRDIVAVSGRSGSWLWSYPIDRAFTANSDPTLGSAGHAGTGRKHGVDGICQRRSNGSASTRRPASRAGTRSTWGSSPSARSSTPTSMATASPKSW